MNIKKIIAREGLILVGFIVVAILLLCISALLPKVPPNLPNGATLDEIANISMTNTPDIPSKLATTIFSLIPFVIFCYPLYLLARFILWAVKTLKKS
jgi:hypothetical protein